MNNERLIKLEDLIEISFQDFRKQYYLIRVNVPLPNLDLSHRTTSNVAPGDLKPSRNIILRIPYLFTEGTDVLAYSLFDIFIHSTLQLHLFKRKAVDNIILLCYAWYAPI